MWPIGNMRFLHRLLVTLTLLTFVTWSVYLRLPGHMVDMVLQQHRMMVRSADSTLLKQWSFEGHQSNDVMCNVTSAEVAHHCNISTYDLYQTTLFDVSSNGEWEMSAPKPRQNESSSPPRLTVLLMPHSHNDPGWLKTVNEYYIDQTRNILNNMVVKLSRYTNMTFIWTETVFFSMWWNEIEDDYKTQVRRLIKRRQLEITLGGWVMPDEASSEYTAVIDQLIEGHQWLWENLAVRPKNSWSIDPFGHSSTMPYLWQKAGMSNMVIQRVHQAVKSSLVRERALEFYWRQMWDDTGRTDIFCHVMPFMLYNIMHTCGPNKFVCSNFDFRQVEGEDAQNRGQPITEYNVNTSAEILYNEYRSKAAYFRQNTILVPLGDDFRYEREAEWDQQYGNYEKLVEYMHSRPDWNVHVRWATLQDYFKAIQKEHRNRKSVKEFPVLSGDFFPYSDRDSAYWTGYYSTRPFDKWFGRQAQTTLRAADILSTFHYAVSKRWGKALDRTFAERSSLLQQARRSLGLFLHHDTITGTSRAFVTEDSEQHLLAAFKQAQQVIAMTLQSLLSNNPTEIPAVPQPETLRRTHTDLPEKQVIPVLESGTTISVFNPLGQARQQTIHLLVNTPVLEVVSSSRGVVHSQVGPAWSKEAEAAVQDNVFELTFVVEIGPFAVASFVVYKRDAPQNSLHISFIAAINCAQFLVPDSSPFRLTKQESQQLTPIKVDNRVIQLTFDPHTGSLLYVQDLSTGELTQLGLSFQAYASRGSGAYIFSSSGPATNFTQRKPAMRTVHGPLTTTVTVAYGRYLTHTVTLYHQPHHLASAIFVENTLNIEDFPGKEVIMRLNTAVQNLDLTYFTDQNGFQLMRRRTNRALAVEANYYPITSAVMLEDHITRLTLLSAQPHGVACLEAGQLEVMLDRHLVYDDNRGLGEGVTDIKTTVSKFVIMVEKRAMLTMPSSRQHSSHSLASLVVSDYLQQPLLAHFATVESPVWQRGFSPFPQPLPCDTSVASLRSLVTGSLYYNGTGLILHRRGYDCNFAATHLPCSPSDSSLTFEKLFRDFPLSRLRATTLTYTATKRTLDVTQRISIAPMELAAFHFHF